MGMITLHTLDGSFVVFDGTISPCTSWAIGFIWDVLMVLVSVLGFAAKNTQAAAAFVAYLSNRITPNLTPLQNAFAGVGSSGPTTTMIWKMIKVLWDADLISSFLSFVWEALSASVSWWTVMRISARLLLWFSPWAAAEVALFLAELAYDMPGLVSDWNDSNNCWASAVVRAA